MPRPAREVPLPPGLRLALDRRARRHGPLLVGGSPRRVLRLSAAGRRALAALEQGVTVSEAARVLGRRLVDAGLAHPRPTRRTSVENIAVVVPVRDRPEHLERCLAAIGPDAAVLVVDDGSREPALAETVAARHGARFVARPAAGGPAAARNTGLAATKTELVAFLDSDCLPTEGWLCELLGHFDDPLVAAVAPRVRPRPVPGGGVVHRYLAACSPMDLGRHEAPVIPGSAVSFVPTAALVVRRSALAAGFDESLRFGEDVDLVWRLHDAGHRIRYEPSATVLHDEPRELRRILARRFRYGTAAAPLAARHPGRLAPAVLHLRPALALAALLAGRPRAAAALAVPQCALLARRATRLGLPASAGLLWFGEAAAHSLLGGARAATMFGWPVALAAAARKRRRAVLPLLALPALVQWRARRPDLDPVRFTAVALLDDAAYGAGVVRGCLAERTVRPLLPSLR